MMCSRWGIQNIFRMINQKMLTSKAQLDPLMSCIYYLKSGSRYKRFFFSNENRPISLKIVKHLFFLLSNINQN